MTAPVIDNWCSTEVKPVHYSFIWTINDFSYCLEEKLCELESSTFCTGTEGLDSKWCLLLYPEGDAEENKDYMSLFLNLVDCAKKEVEAKFRFSVLNERKEECKSRKIKEAHKFILGTDSSWGFRQFVERDYLMTNNLLPEDKLTIKCAISLVREPRNQTGHFQPNPVVVKIPEDNLRCDLANMLNNCPFRDVTLCVQTQEFKAHKAVLAGRSPVFRAMFEHNLEENKNNRVEIPDIIPDVFGNMLEFIYTGQATTIDNAADLLVAADKYCLERLKIICEDELARNLSTDNVSEVLILSDMHSADQLKRQAVRFFTKHTADVMVTQGWKTLVTDHPHLTLILMAEGFQALAGQTDQINNNPPKLPHL